jgi:glycosyltransferase involved in cell wall biosynthesis
MLTHDVYPDVISSAGFLSKRSFAYRVARVVGSSIFRSMDMVIVLGRDMDELIKRHLGKSKVPVNIIPNWADTESVYPLPRRDNRLLRQLNLSAKFVVQYSGNIGRTHGIETIVEAARRLRSYPDICFLFIGWGAKEAWLRNTIKSEQLDNIMVLPPRPRDEIVVSLNACDLAMLSFVSGMAGVSIPSRIYNIMSAGKPMLAAADKTSEIAMVINEEKIGVVVEPENPAQFAEAILALRNDSRRLSEMSKRSRQAAMSKYAEPLIIARYTAALARWLDEDLDI